MSKPLKNSQSFRATFDSKVIIPNKIRAALDSLHKEGGPEAWEEEVHFLRRAGINAQSAAAHREAFKAHIVEAKKPGNKPINIWFSDTKVAAAERRNLGS